ncbi:unnamed protein product [Sphagnum balticum]
MKYAFGIIEPVQAVVGLRSSDQPLQLQNIFPFPRRGFPGLSGEVSHKSGQPSQWIIQGEEDVDLAFEFMFGEECPAYFAFAYPYSYGKLECFLEEVQTSVIGQSDVYFNQEVLIYSNEHRKVHLLTVTDRSNCLEGTEEPIEGLFERGGSRPLKIRKRPRVLITVRVHPGETSASFCF